MTGAGIWRREGLRLPRPQKIGLDYFPVDVDIFSDLKVRILMARFGSDGFAFYMYLLARVYRDGYYIQADDDFFLIAAADLNMSVEKIGQMMHFLLGRSLFKDTLFKSDKVITSTGIQRRYQEAVKSRASKKAVKVEGRYWLLRADDTESYIQVQINGDKSEKNNDKSEKNSNKSEIYTTKESRVEKSRAKESSASDTEKRLIAEYGKQEYDRYIAKAHRYGRNGDAAIFTAAEWMAEDVSKGKIKARKGTSMDLSAYEDMVSNYIPVYGRGDSG